MKISKKRLVEIIEEEAALVDGMHAEYSMDGIDEEGKMAKRQLHDLANYSHELCDMLADATQLESWVQAKITKAADYIKTVKHYVEYGMEEGAYDQVSSEMDPVEPVGVEISEPYEVDDSEMVKIMRE